MYDRLAAALLGLSAGAGHIIKRGDMLATSPVKRAFFPKFTQDKINDGLVKHANDLNVNSRVGIAPTRPTPEHIEILNKFPQGLNANYPAGVLQGVPTDIPIASINPNASRIWAAKSLGGAVASQTKVGKIINDINTAYSTNVAKSPMLTKALMASTFLAPMGLSAVIDGDDDTAAAVASASLPIAAIPLAKEAYDTYQGQRILDKSGLKTSLGQRGKYAGNLLSMMAYPILAGSAGNMVGNILDEDVPASL